MEHESKVMLTSIFLFSIAIMLTFWLDTIEALR